MMPDREKVIKGIHQHCEGSMFDRCGECPYYDVADEPFICRDMLLNDLNELLKEQEAVEPKKTAYQRVDHTIAYWYRCGTCGLSIFPSYKYCPFCGRSVKWDA